MKILLKKIIPLFAIALLIGAQTLYAQSDLQYFDGIDLRGNIDVVLVQGNETSIEIDKYDRNRVSVSVEKGILSVKRKKPLKIKEYEDDAIDIRITYQKLNELKARSGAHVRNQESIQSNHLHIDLNSGAKAKLTLDAGDLEVKAGEGAQLRMRGKAESIDAKVSTGAKIDAFSLESEYVYVKASTGGEADVFATELIEASAHTGGDVDYKGSPKKVRVDDKLGGDVNNKG